MSVSPVVYADGQHRVGSLSELGVVSSVSTNLLTWHNSGGVYLDGTAIVSNGESQNLIVVSHVDNRLYLSPSILKNAGFVDGVSEDAGNLLAKGTDGNPVLKIGTLTEAGLVRQTDLSSLLNSLGYVTSATVSTLLSNSGYVTRSELASYPTRAEVSNMISSAGGGSSTVTPTVTPSTLISSTTGNLLKVGTDGKLLVESTGDGGSASPTVLAPNLLSKDAASGYGNLLTVGSDGLLLVPNDCGELTD